MLGIATGPRLFLFLRLRMITRIDPNCDTPWPRWINFAPVGTKSAPLTFLKKEPEQPKTVIAHKMLKESFNKIVTCHLTAGGRTGTWVSWSFQLDCSHHLVIDPGLNWRFDVVKHNIFGCCFPIYHGGSPHQAFSLTQLAISTGDWTGTNLRECCPKTNSSRMVDHSSWVAWLNFSASTIRW